MNDMQEKLRAISGLQPQGTRRIVEPKPAGGRPFRAQSSPSTVADPLFMSPVRKPEAKPEPARKKKKRRGRSWTAAQRFEASEAMKARWKNPDFVKAQAKAARADLLRKRTDPKFNAKRLKGLRKHFSDREK